MPAAQQPLFHRCIRVLAILDRHNVSRHWPSRASATQPCPSVSSEAVRLNRSSLTQGAKPSSSLEEVTPVRSQEGATWPVAAQRRLRPALQLLAAHGA